MNNNFFRLIFSKSRNLLMVVSEIAKSHTKNNRKSQKSNHYTSDRLSILCLNILIGLALGFITLIPISFAQIVSDPSAPKKQQATILNTANGLIQVNIQTPSNAGVSRNKYTQYDVPKKGIILNNSRKNIKTKIGGWIQANPWLKKGTAKIILNEINSANPSYIKGFIEVAGRRAEVVIANPSGISVNGGGFINANRVTLTTGSTIMNNGALDGFRVEQGEININRSGLNTSEADYTGILARAVKVNAGIWAKELKVITGTNIIDSTHNQHNTIVGKGEQPLYALDVSQLGGMYANKIWLIGTEHGLGFANNGTISSTNGELILNNDGWLRNSKNIQSQQSKIKINTTSTINNSGNIKAADTLSINSCSSIESSGHIDSRDSINIFSVGNITNSGIFSAHEEVILETTNNNSNIFSSDNSSIIVGLTDQQTLANSGNISVNTVDKAQLNGNVIAPQSIKIEAQQLNISESLFAAKDIELNASSGEIEASNSNINAEDTLTFTTTEILRSDNATIIANQIIGEAHDISNINGSIIQQGSGDLTLTLDGDLNNHKGNITSNSEN